MAQNMYLQEREREREREREKLYLMNIKNMASAQLRKKSQYNIAK
jgi:hypothetical protein